MTLYSLVLCLLSFLITALALTFLVAFKILWSKVIFDRLLYFYLATLIIIGITGASRHLQALVELLLHRYEISYYGKLNINTVALC